MGIHHRNNQIEAQSHSVVCDGDERDAVNIVSAYLEIKFFCQRDKKISVP